MWERVLQFVEKKHSEKVATDPASVLFNDTCLTLFHHILKGREYKPLQTSFIKTACK